MLDGVTVEAGEQAASRNLYAGRLTLDSLVERVGHSHFERLREVDLSGMGLKELGDVFTKEEGHFTGIQMLTLDNNELTEVSLFWSHPQSHLQNGSGRITKVTVLLITGRGETAGFAEFMSLNRHACLPTVGTQHDMRMITCCQSLQNCNVSAVQCMCLNS